MEFRDLKKQYQTLKPEIDEAILKVMQNSNFISGAQVQELEKELANYVGRAHCIACANGTDALSMVLMAWGIKAGDAVFVPDFTFFASGEVVSFEGATPVFVDVLEETFNIDAQKLEAAIIKTQLEGKLVPRAIIAVDLFGLPADYNAIELIAKKYNLLILEDGAQGFGGRIGERRACSFGDAATTSFFPAKPMGCYGDGGAIFTDDDEVAKYLRSVQVHGKGEYKYDNIRIGVNSRLDTIQAAILLVKLKAFRDYELVAVNSVAEKYSNKLSKIAKVPAVPDKFYSSWAQYTLRLENAVQREKFQQNLKEKHIPTMVYYPKPMHLQKAFAELGGQAGDFLVTEKLCECVVSIPMHPYLTDEEIDFICSEIKNIL